MQLRLQRCQLEVEAVNFAAQPLQFCAQISKVQSVRQRSSQIDTTASQPLLRAPNSHRDSVVAAQRLLVHRMLLGTETGTCEASPSVAATTASSALPLLK